MNRIIVNANEFDAKLEGFSPDELAQLDDTLALDSDEVFAFKDHVALAQVEGRITLAEAETLQHAITLNGWREGLSLGLRAAVYLSCAELLGVGFTDSDKRVLDYPQS